MLRKVRYVYSTLYTPPLYFCSLFIISHCNSFVIVIIIILYHHYVLRFIIIVALFHFFIAKYERIFKFFIIDHLRQTFDFAPTLFYFILFYFFFLITLKGYQLRERKLCIKKIPLVARPCKEDSRRNKRKN